MSFLPLSIPSPPEEWQVIDIAAWLESTFGIDLPFALRITAYALCILVGIVAATILTNRRLTARGVEKWVTVDVIIWAVPLGLVGARLYHVFTHPDDYFGLGGNPWNPFEQGSVWAIWEGGNAIFGAIIGGAIGAWIGCRIAGVRFWSFADALAPGMLLAQALGRFGNYFNQELYGQPTDLPWGLEIDANNPAFPVGLLPDTLFHPTFLYEMIWNVVGIVFLLSLERKWRLGRAELLGMSLPVPVAGKIRLQWGKVWALYMIWYGIGRAWFESIRVDPSEVILGLRVNIWGAIVMIALGIALFVVQSRNHPGEEPSAYVPGREPAPEGAVDSEQTYSDSDEPGNGATAPVAQKTD